jgi:hypothetical protein
MYGDITVKVKFRLEVYADIPDDVIDQEMMQHYEDYFSQIMYTDVDMSVFKKVIVRSIHEMKDES